MLGKISIINNYVNAEDITKICIKESENNLIACSSSTGSLFIENYGYDDVFDRKKINNIDNWYLEITYSKNDANKTDIIPIKNNIIMRNNKFIIKKSSHI